MNYGFSYSSGTDDDLLSSHRNRFQRGGRTATGYGRSATVDHMGNCVGSEAGRTWGELGHDLQKLMRTTPSKALVIINLVFIAFSCLSKELFFWDQILLSISRM